MMKILYVGHTYTIRANQAKIAALARVPNTEILLVTPHRWKGPLYHNRTEEFTPEYSNVRHVILRALGVGKEGAYLFTPSLFRVIREFRPEVVHVEQGAYALVYTQILLALMLFAPTARALFFTWWNLPYGASGLKAITERFNLRHSAAAVAGNESAKRILIDHGFREPVSVLPQLGIEMRDFDEARRAAKREDSFVIGYVGRIAYEKGVLDLVRAVGQMREKRVVLRVVGNGDAVTEMERLAHSLGVTLEHTAAVRNEEVPTLLGSMHVLVLPSRTTTAWVEQFGHILLEAMAAQLPVVGSSSGEIPNVIGDGGVVFPEGDIAKLSAVLDRLAADPIYLKQIADAGLARVQAQYTHDAIARAQVRIYSDLLRHGKPVGSPNRLKLTSSFNSAVTTR